MTRSALPRALDQFVTPADLAEARRRIVECDRQIESICKQLSDRSRKERLQSVEYASWANRARRARERFREEEARLYRWISEHHLDLLRECASVIETLEDLNGDEEMLLDRLDEVLENK